MKQESWKRLLPWSRSRTSRERNLLLRGRLTVLREKRPGDAEADYRWRVDPELAALDATTPLRLTREEYERYFRDELKFPSPWSVRLAIDSLDGVHIGNVMYYDIDEQRRQAELGIMIGDRRYWDSGYGSDAARTLLRHIFADTEIERVYLHTLQSNGRARSAFRKCGFEEMRSVQREGHDFVLMEVRRDDWLRRHAGAAEDGAGEPLSDAASAEIAGGGSEPAG